LQALGSVGDQPLDMGDSADVALPKPGLRFRFRREELGGAPAAGLDYQRICAGFEVRLLLSAIV